MADGFKIGDAFVAIHADTKGLAGDIDKGLSGADGNISKKGSGMGGKLMAGIALGIAGAAALVTGPIMDAIGKASDMAENQSKVNTVFGESAIMVSNFAKNSVEAYGLSNSAALDYMGGLGNMYTQLGMTSDNAAVLSESALQMAADLGSFHNASTPEVLDAYNAALRGEYDSMQKYIPTLNAATVEKKALEMTGKANVSQLTAEDKALAAHTYMTENMGAAVGDFANTSDGAANQQKMLGAALENLAATFGTALLPAFTELVSFLNTSVMPAFQGMMDFFAANPVVLQIFGVALGVLAIGFGIAAVAVWAMNSALLANPITWIILAVVALIAAIVLLVMNWDQVVAWITEVWAGFISWITGVIEGFVGWWNGIWAAVGQFISDVWNNIVAWVTGVWNGFIGWIMGIVNGFFGWWNGIWAAVGAFIAAVWNAIVATVSGFVNNIVNFIVSGITGMYNNWMSIWNGVSSTVSTVVGNVKGFIGDVISNITSIPGKIGAALSGAANWLVNTGRDVISGLINGIKNNLGNIATTIMGGVNNAINSVKSFLGIASPSRLFRDEIGKMLPAGMEVGIEAGESSLNKTIAHMVQVPDVPELPINVSSAANRYGAAGTASDQSADVINWSGNIVIDAKNVDDFNRVIALMDNLKAVARQGRTNVGVAY